ncbi:hypothetical protein C1645_738624 [Glomus cerebriforme]|uniref:Uncharacterized protein n=1 Tax=Glomus cerebriforme TaxID=658196 RepID=A0A397STL6_9GLOM|nr:hypothetical protein C1645_738624 [Glomus cerebriforme]
MPEKQFYIPICVNMRIKLKLNKTEFIVHIVKQDVWSKLNILNNINGKDLFGINDQHVIMAIQNYIDKSLCCVTEWNNDQIMTCAFEQCLKRKISVSGLNWNIFFIEWKQRSSSVIELSSHLTRIYPENYELIDRELRAWRSMMRKVGCMNITPFTKKQSSFEFWTYSSDPSNDQALISYLYTENLLNGMPYNLLESDIKIENMKMQNTIDKFWMSFDESIQMNKHRFDEKTRILSIIVNKFGHREIQVKLKISNDLISVTKKYVNTNGPGCIATIKPIITKS